MGFKTFATAVQLIVKHRLALIKAASHVDLLRTLPGKQETNRRRDHGRLFLEEAFWITCTQHLLRVGCVLANDHPSVAKRPSAEMQRERRVGEIDFPVLAQMRSEVGGGGFQRG